jgi:dihydroorotate dehydrogenase (subfamily 1) family protein
MTDTSVKLFGRTLENPIIPASGTFGFGYEFAEYYDINILGSLSLKGTTLLPRYGNPLPRIAECPSGILNSIGLQNPGADAVINEELPKLRKVCKKPFIINIGGETFEDYIETVKKFNGVKDILAIELNVSCPNVRGGGMAFGVDGEAVRRLTGAVKAASVNPVIVKLSPNVADIVSIAKAAEDAGADAVSLINTLVGTRIDLISARPVLAAKTGGYSGPGVFPVALRMVCQVSSAVKIPVLGMGGISSAYEVIEMTYAGASAVMVGTANLVDPFACKKIIEKLPLVMSELNIERLSDIVGRAKNG